MKQVSKRLNLVKRILCLCFIACVLVLVGFSSISLAKYYAKRDNKGVSVASGLYFNSNCISNLAGSIDTALTDIDLSQVPGYVNPEGGSVFYMDIRNYDNHLLYNELYLDVEYTISFLKINGETASVEYTGNNGTNVQKILGDGEVFTLTGRTLAGGAARYHRYTVRTTNALDGSDAKVLVMAYPTEPNYVASAAEKMRLIGILQANPRNIAVGIDESCFLIEKTAEYVSNWKATVEKMSGLVYIIQTNGDDVSSTGAIKGELEVTWNAKMLDINQYDTYYEEAVRNGRITTSGDYKTMKIKVLPYANVRITFYKTADFISAFGTSMTKTQFENYVKAELAASE